jgi:hypothetical protein
MPPRPDVARAELCARGAAAIKIFDGSTMKFFSKPANQLFDGQPRLPKS